MALVEFEAISFNLKFHLSAETMATHRMLIPNGIELSVGPLRGRSPRMREVRVERRVRPHHG